MKQPAGLLLVGEVGKPHGTSGEVYVMPISDDPNRFDEGVRLIHNDGRHLVVERSRTHRARMLVKFEGVDNRDDAEGLRGSLYVTPGDLRTLGGAEYWEHEIVGSEVFTQDGKTVGKVTSLIQGEAQDSLQVQTAAGERLIPLVNEIVLEINVDEGRIVVAPPPGLLD